MWTLLPWGSKYSGTGISTHYYNAIGVAGAPAGTAFESYQTNENHTPRLGRDALPPLIGSLMLDIRQNYYFVPSSYPELEVAAGTSDNHGCATFSYNGGAPATQCVWGPDIRGGFVIWAVDRLLGSVTDHYGLPTNSTHAVEAKKAIDDFAYLLNVYYKRNDLLVITTFGTPIGANALITPDLFFAINALGGTGILLPKLTTDTSTYTLISSRDPEYVRAHYPLQSSSPSGGTGQVHAMLSRDRNNRFVLNTGASDQALSHTIGFPWTEVGFQQAQDWPAWTAGQQGAYEDLYSSENHYPAIRERLGCAGILVCQPIRSYYDGGIGSSGTAPGIVGFPYRTLIYHPNPNYTERDFDAVIQQLNIEGAFEANVYLLYGQFKAVTAGQTDNVQYQLSKLAQNIDVSLQKGNSGSTELVAYRLAQASAATGVFSIAPGIGPAFGAISVVLGAASAFVPAAASGVPDFSRYGYTLQQLKDQNLFVGTNAADSTNDLFTGIVNDWGKLSTIGGGYGSQNSPWYMCVTCSGSNVPTSALPAFSLGAKRRFYLALLPTVYSADSFVEQPQDNPKKIASRASAAGTEFCVAPYKDAPAASFWSNPSIRKPSTWDINIITQTARTQCAFCTWYTLNFPSQALLDDLFNAPTLNGVSPAPPLTGGSGLAQDQLMPSGGYLAQRPGYIVSSHSCTPSP